MPRQTKTQGSGKSSAARRAPALAARAAHGLAPHTQTAHASSAQALTATPQSLAPTDILALQQSVGNQATRQILGAMLSHAVSPVQSKPATGVIQAMAWPKKKKGYDHNAVLVQPLQTYWTDASEADAKLFYAWCSSEDHYFEIPRVGISQEHWKSELSKFPNSNAFYADKGNDVSGYAAYLKSKAAPPVAAFKQYDMNSYRGPSEELQRKTLSVLGIEFRRIEAISRSHYRLLLEPDKHREAAKWEKANNVRDAAAITVRNEIINKTTEEIDMLLREVGAEKARNEARERAEAERQVEVQASVNLATQLPEFTAVNADQLASAVWNSAVNNAGKTGYLEVDATTYPEADVRRATRLLNTFSEAWKAAHAEREFLKNPHCPGGGRVQNKLVGEHGSLETRRSIYQANFIATWGADDTVIHINADRAST